MIEYDPKLRWTYRILGYAIGFIFIIALISDVLDGPPSRMGPRIVGLIIIGVEALVWAWLIDRRWR